MMHGQKNIVCVCLCVWSGSYISVLEFFSTYRLKSWNFSVQNLQICKKWHNWRSRIVGTYTFVDLFVFLAVRGTFCWTAWVADEWTSGTVLTGVRGSAGPIATLPSTNRALTVPESNQDPRFLETAAKTLNCGIQHICMANLCLGV